MDPKNLAKAKQNYEIQKKLLDPERYVSLDVFRNCVPDTFKRGMPGPGVPGGAGVPSIPGGPGDAGGPGASLAEDTAKAKVLAKYLAGGRIEDTVLSEMFGFTNAELEAVLKENDPIIKPIPEKLVLMTFDDSTLDHYTVACPILEKYGGKANLFTCEMVSTHGRPGFEDKTRYMTWEQIEELSNRGHEIVNHSWHHAMEFQTGTDDYILSEIHGLEERCAQYGIPKPTVFGAPGGGFTRHIEEILHREGYLWGRGDLRDGNPVRLGEVLYDPYVDTPMVVPNQNPYSEKRLKEILDGTANNKVALFVFHEVNDEHMMQGMSFEEQVRGIYEYGGRCITFRELSEYVDPLKAYAYTH